MLGEWPPLENCPAGSKRANATRAELESIVSRNPGDSQAWIQLALLTQQPGAPLDSGSKLALDAATLLARQDYRVQRLQAALALKEERWSDATDWLIRLVRDNGNANGDPAVVLASLLLQPQAVKAMQTQVGPDSRWLASVIDALPRAKIPAVAMLPVMIYALDQKAVTLELLQKALKSLRAQGAWLEAHAFWLAWLGRPVPLIFNGDFNQGFLPDTFDWRILPVAPSKSGALVSQGAMPGRGGVLVIDFTGRRLQPVPLIEQNLILLNKSYVLGGQFMASKLASNSGLHWSLRCNTAKVEFARTEALMNITEQWSTFSLTFNIPPNCKQAVTLGLVPGSVDSSTSGMRGQVWFDNLQLSNSP